MTQNCTEMLNFRTSSSCDIYKCQLSLSLSLHFRFVFCFFFFFHSKIGIAWTKTSKYWSLFIVLFFFFMIIYLPLLCCHLNHKYSRRYEIPCEQWNKGSVNFKIWFKLISIHCCFVLFNINSIKTRVTIGDIDQNVQ